MKILNISLFLIIFLGFLAFAQTGDLNNRLMLATSFEQAGELEKAKNIYEELYKLQPNNQVYFQNLNRVYVALKNYKGSIKIIDENIKRTPDDVNLYGLSGSSYYLDGNESMAYRQWETAIKMQPANETVYRLIANYALERRAFEKAIDILKKGKSIAKDIRSFSYDLAGLYTLTMNYTEATEEYSSILLNFPDQLSYIESRILTYITKPDALDLTISILEKRKKETNTSFYYLLSHLYIEKKNFDKAFEYYLFIDKKLNRQGAELFSLAQKVLNEGNDEVAAKIFDYIMINYPSSSFYSASKLGYAKSLESRYENESLINKNEWLAFSVRKFGNENEYKKILEIYSEIIKTYPFSEVAVEAYYRRGMIYYTKLNMAAKAKENFNIIIKDFQLSQFYPFTCDVMSDISLQEGNLAESSDYLSKILLTNRSNESQRANAELKRAKISFYKNDFTGTKEILGKIISNLQDNSANDALEMSLLINTTIDDSVNLAAYSGAMFLAERNMYTEAAEKFKLIALKKDNFVLSSLASVNRAELLIALEKYDEGIEILNLIAAEREKNIYSDKALYLKAKTFQYFVKDLSKAIENYQEILARYPNSLYLEESREEITKLRNKSS